MTKFRTFRPYWEYDGKGHDKVYKVHISADIQINDWLAENPNVEIISWQATAAGDYNELYITIQYKENK